MAFDVGPSGSLVGPGSGTSGLVGPATSADSLDIQAPGAELNLTGTVTVTGTLDIQAPGAQLDLSGSSAALVTGALDIQGPAGAVIFGGRLPGAVLTNTDKLDIWVEITLRVEDPEDM